MSWHNIYPDIIFTSHNYFFPCKNTSNNSKIPRTNAEATLEHLDVPKFQLWNIPELHESNLWFTFERRPDYRRLRLLAAPEILSFFHPLLVFASLRLGRRKKESPAPLVFTLFVCKGPIDLLLNWQANFI